MKAVPIVLGLLYNETHSLLAKSVVSNHSPFSHLAPPHFELRLNEEKPIRLGSHPRKSGKEKAQRDKRHIGHYEVDGQGNIFGFKMSSVYAFEQDHSRMISKLFMNLAAADIHCDDALRAILQKAIRKTTG